MQEHMNREIIEFFPTPPPKKEESDHDLDNELDRETFKCFLYKNYVHVALLF